MHKWNVPPWSLVVVAAILYIGLRLPYLHIRFFSVDEAVSAVVGMEILEGGLPYVDAIDHRGPLTYLFYAGIFSLFGGWDMLAVQVVYLGLIVLMCLVLFRLGKKMDGAWMGAWAALFYAWLVWNSPFFEMWPAHTEWLLTLCSTLGYIAYVIAPNHPGDGTAMRRVALVAAGALFGLGFLSKQLGALEAAGIALYLVLELGWRQGRWWAIWREVGWMLLGWCIPLLILLLIYARVDALSDLWFYGWRYNTRYYVGLQDWGTRLDYTIKLFPAFFMNKVLIAALLGSCIWIFPWKQIRSHQGPLPWYWLLLGWCVATWIQGAIGGRAFQHYLIPSIAPVCLLAAWVLQRWGQIVRQQQHVLNAAKFGVFLSLMLPILQQWQAYKFIRGDDPLAANFQPVSQYIAAHSHPTDRIFVWGFAPEIYVLSERHPASRFNFCTFLVGFIPGVNLPFTETAEHQVPGSWQALSQDLTETPPVLIIDAAHSRPDFKDYRPENYPLWALIQSDYEPVSDFVPDSANPYRIWQRKIRRD